MEKQYSILLIDDDDDAAKALAYDLKAKGHKALGFSKINEFFNHFRLITPEIVLVDMVNLDMPGWQICKKIRDSFDLKNTIVIAISGVLDTDDIDRMNVTADIFLQKPLNADDVDNAIERFLSSHPTRLKP